MSKSSVFSCKLITKYSPVNELESYYLWNIGSCGLGDVFPVDANKVRMRFEVHDAVLAQSHLVARVMIRVKMTIMALIMKEVAVVVMQTSSSSFVKTKQNTMMMMILMMMMMMMLMMITIMIFT